MILILSAINPIVTNVLVVLFLIVCLFLILTVLIQRPMGGGLAGAFGSGAGSGQTAFGTKTGDALTIATITMFVIYVLFAVGLNFAVSPPTGSAPVVAPPVEQQPAEAPKTPANGTTPPVTGETPKQDAPASTEAPKTDTPKTTETPKPAGAQPEAPKEQSPQPAAPTPSPAGTPSQPK